MSDVKNLTLIGLKMEDINVRKATEKYHNNSTEIACELLQQWKESVADPVQAFDILHKALLHKEVKLISIASKLRYGSLED